MSGFSKSLIGDQWHFLWQTTAANIRVQHEYSVLGIFWHLLSPIGLFIVLYVVFSQRLGADIPHYPAYLLVGIIVWNFFNEGTQRAMYAIVNQSSIIKALPVRRDMLVLSAVLTTILKHGIEIFFLIGVLAWMGLLSWHIVFFPVIVAFHLSFVFGIGMLLASGFVYFRDLGQIWGFLIKLFWLCTPIFYALTPTGPGQKINFFNPMYYMITTSRDVLVYARMPEITDIAMLALFSIASLVVGWVLFKIFSARLAECL
jgi:ABC-type polysaccharide/polyol phosphate export permease